MFFIPGWLIGILTFPGVIVHEAAHKLFCDIAKVKVHTVCYFRVGNPAGYVIHEEPKNLKSAFLISVGPLIVNSLLCMILTLSTVIPFILLGINWSHHLVTAFLAWVGYSIGMHAFPSNDDMQMFLGLVKSSHRRDLLYWSSWGFAWLIKIANALRIIWFDLFYAMGISMILPLLISSF